MGNSKNDKAPTFKHILNKNGSFKFWGISTAVVTIIFISLALSKVNEVISDKEFIASTVPANATIIKKYSPRTIEYEFTSINGDIIKNTISTKPSYTNKIAPGDTIAIFYAPHNPKESFLPQELKVDYFEGVPTLVFVFVVLVLTPTIILLDTIRKARIVFNLFQNGINTKAKIYKIELCDEIHINEETLPMTATISYQFQDKQGQQVKGNDGKYITEQLYYKDIASFLKPGTKLTFDSSYMTITESELIDDATINILYNPKKPDENIWIDQYR